MTGPGETAAFQAAFRLGYVPGATPGKWARIWAERRPDVPLELVRASTDEAVELVRAGDVDAALVRLPTDRSGLHLIPLYTETTVVVVPKDHLLTAADDAALAELADEIVLHPRDDVLEWPGERPGRPAAFAPPATTAAAIELVAAGAGLLVVPQSLARLHHRRDLAHLPLADAPSSGVGLAWPDAETTDLMEELIGIVRGRTVNSSRTPRRDATPAPERPAPTRRSTTSRAPARRTRRHHR